MSKLGAPKDDVLYAGEWLTVQVMRVKGRSRAMEWYEALGERGLGRFQAACATLETSLRSNRPPAGRAESVKGSKVGLSELKVTKPGGNPPHYRALFLRRGRTIWIAVGFTKQTNELKKKDIKAGEGVAEAWIAEREATE